MIGQLYLLTQGSSPIASHLYGMPNFSFYKYVLRRNTNFAIGNIELFNETFNISTMHNLQNGKSIELNSEFENLDLLSNIFLSFKLPDIYSSDLYKFKWVENIGSLLIKRITFLINDQDIDSITGEWLCIWNELTLPVKDNYNKISGNIPEMSNPRTIEKIIRIRNNIISDFDYLSSDKNNPNNAPSIKSKWICVPIPFWFTKAPNLALPVFQNILDKNIIRINILFEDIEKLYTVYSDIYNMNISPSYYNDLYNTKITINNFINNNNIGVRLDASCILLDTQEKENLANICSNSGSQEYLFETIKINSGDFTEGTTSISKVDINSSFLVKEIVWTLKRGDAIYNFNDILNYSYSIPFDNEKSIMKDALLKWNNESITNTFNSYYFNHIQPYLYHSAVPKQGIYLYSFSILPEKSIHSGSYDAAKLNLSINMTFNKYEESVLDAMYEKKFNRNYKLSSNNKDIKYTLYIIQYNFLTINANFIDKKFRV
jgi:hypothetical protein